MLEETILCQATASVWDEQVGLVSWLHCVTLTDASKAYKAAGLQKKDDQPW